MSPGRRSTGKKVSPPAPFRVLELAAGNSPVLRSLPTRYMGKREIEYAGIDDNLRNFQRTQIPANIRHSFFQADALKFLNERVPANHFDEIHLHLAHVSPWEKQTLLSKAFHALKPGGLFFLAEQQDHPEEEYFQGRKVPVMQPQYSAQNKKLAESIRKTGFEIVRIQVTTDPGIKNMRDVRIPPGVEPERGRKFPTQNPLKIIQKLSDNPEFVTQFLVLRKPRK